jgi:hypothetical protein
VGRASVEGFYSSTNPNDDEVDAAHQEKQTLVGRSILMFQFSSMAEREAVNFGDESSSLSVGAKF